MIVFSGLLSVLFLKRQLWAYNWAGISLCVCGIVLVGSAGALSAAAVTDEDHGHIVGEGKGGKGRSFFFGNILIEHTTQVIYTGNIHK